MVKWLNISHLTIQPSNHFPLLVELLVATMIICSTLIASSQLLSAFGAKHFAAFRKTTAVQMTQNEMEKVLAVRKRAWAAIDATYCNNTNGTKPCYAVSPDGRWDLKRGSLVANGYTVTVSVVPGGTNRKEVRVKTTWGGFGGGELEEKIILTNP